MKKIALMLILSSFLLSGISWGQSRKPEIDLRYLEERNKEAREMDEYRQRRYMENLKLNIMREQLKLEKERNRIEQERLDEEKKWWLRK